MLRHNRSTQDSSSHPQLLQSSGETHDVIELNLQGEIVGEWLIRLINDQTDYFAQKAFSDSFRCGHDDTDLQRQVQYLQAVRDRLQPIVKEGELSRNSVKVKLTASISEG